MVVLGKALDVRAGDENVERTLCHLRQAGSVPQAAYQDPNARFMSLILERGLSEQPYFPLVAPMPAMLIDQVAFAHAWKSLLFEEVIVMFSFDSGLR